MEKLLELSNLVGKLKRNRENVPETARQTRYRRAFERLENEIMEVQKQAFWEIIPVGMRIADRDQEARKQAKHVIEEIYNKNAARIEQDAKETLIDFCNMDLYILSMLDLQYDYMENFYVDYWLSHTKMLGGVYYNDLIDMWFSNGEWKDAKGTFSYALPPTREGCVADIAERRAATEREVQSRFPQAAVS